MEVNDKGAVALTNILLVRSSIFSRKNMCLSGTGLKCLYKLAHLNKPFLPKALGFHFIF